MFRDGFINFLETAVVLLTLTNAFSVLVAVYAISLARGVIRPDSQAPAPYSWVYFLARRLGINN
jgi:hypothetical protein